MSCTCFLYHQQKQLFLSSTSLLCCMPWGWLCLLTAGGWTKTQGQKKPIWHLNKRALSSGSMVLSEGRQIWAVLSACLLLAPQEHSFSHCLHWSASLSIPEPAIRTSPCPPFPFGLAQVKILFHRLSLTLCVNPLNGPWVCFRAILLHSVCYWAGTNYYSFTVNGEYTHCLFWLFLVNSLYFPSFLPQAPSALQVLLPVLCPQEVSMLWHTFG